MEVRTKGNVIVNHIKVGDVHYEYDWGIECKSVVVQLPKKDTEKHWHWWSVEHHRYDPSLVYSLIIASNSDDRYLEHRYGLIHYGVTEGYTHYSVNLYDYQAYETHI